MLSGTHHRLVAQVVDRVADGVRVVAVGVGARVGGLRVDHPLDLGELDPDKTCDGIDLLAIAERAPALTRLRISGCPSSIHAGLSAFGSRLTDLTLADKEN